MPLAYQYWDRTEQNKYLRTLKGRVYKTAVFLAYTMKTFDGRGFHSKITLTFS